MKKSSYNWIWKWHMIAGLVSFPVVFILAITGIIYLFKDQYEKPRQASIREVEVKAYGLSYQDQLDIVRQSWDKPINNVVVPKSENQATEFISGRFSGKSSLFIDPYTGKVAGTLAARDTDMFKVRKLHGELLAGSFGTKIVELVGSWLIVLILTGLFLFLPRKRSDWIKLFRVRFGATRAVLFRDLHMVVGFWFSLLLLLILAGGMPWTDVWGDGFKWVQKQTDTGYPAAWHGMGIQSTPGNETIALDEVVQYAKSLGLPGEIAISFPKSPTGVFSIHNTFYPDQSKQVAIHLDQYSGHRLAHLQWKEVGVLMRGRMWAMAFHQGQFGPWNWFLVLATAAGLMVLSISGLVSFFLRKKPGKWQIPTSNSYRVSIGFYMIVVVLGVFLPLFGLSVVLVWLGGQIKRMIMRNIRDRSMVMNT